MPSHQKWQILLSHLVFGQLDNMERETGDTLCAGPVLLDFLFGSEDGKDLTESLKDLDRYKSLRSWTAQQWAKLLEDTLINAPSFTLSGVPSKKLAEQLESETQKRVEENKQKYGEEGLKKLQEKVDAAREENDRPIPQESVWAVSA